MARSSYGWSELSTAEKRELIDAIASGRATRAPRHVELDLTDRCNVACYFCNQQDLRTSQQLSTECAIRIIDELVAGGLRAVRLSGGGDPLFHRDVVRILGYLSDQKVVVDNLTTNGVGLTAEVADLLVSGNAHEVIVSLNAVDGADYHRMMAVKPEFFARVVANVATLVKARGAGTHPFITLQFLLDRGNFTRLPEMYRIGRDLGVDRIAVAPVLEIPRDRVPHDVLLVSDDAAHLEPCFREVLEADRDVRLLEPSYLLNWGGWLERLYHELQVPIPAPYAVASTYKTENGGCFFGWYSMVVTGNGDVRPCCYLLQPDYPPLGNIATSTVADVWNGPEYERLRYEMREVLLAGDDAEYREGDFRRLTPQCVKINACWLKNGHFRGDEEFYRELGEALDRERAAAKVG
jgi:MoaA/NifB/PqqE/SkfB family radical SAM enzyme